MKTRHVPSILIFIIILSSLVMIGAKGPGVVYLYPDLITVDSYLNENYHVYPGGDTVELWLSNGVGNDGQGQLYLYGVLPANPDGSQDVYQRIFDEFEDTYFDRLAGRFVYHPPHAHTHFEDWAIFRLRAIDWFNDPDSGLGQIMKEGEKLGYCIIDNDTLLPRRTNSPAQPIFTECDELVQGISVGWADVYAAGIEGQSIDITDVSNGVYWLESVADPDNLIAESNENNNVARVQVRIIHKDDYEPNNSASQVDPMPWGGTNSSNFGPCNNPRFINTLNIHPDLHLVFGDQDYYKFYMNGWGQDIHFVEILFNHDEGDLNLELLDSEGLIEESSSGTVDYETITLSGKPPGWYYVRVFPKQTTITSANYWLMVKAPSNEICGDVNGDGIVSSADIIALNNYLNGTGVACPKNADVNGDCHVDVADRDYLVNYVYSGGPPPHCDCL